MWIKKQPLINSDDLDPELKQITSDVMVVPDKDPAQTLLPIRPSEGFIPGETSTGIFTEADQDVSRMAIPDPSGDSPGSVTLQQLNAEVTRTNLEWNDRIAEDTPKDSGIYGVSQVTEPLPKPVDESDSRMSFPHLSVQQTDPTLYDPALGSAAPITKTQDAQDPLFQLREVILNTQKQLAQGWDAMVKVFESTLKPITAGMFIAPDEEDLP